MKSIIMALFIILSASITFAATPTTLRFIWEYDADAQAVIEGFKLYENNQPMSIVIPPTARTVETPYTKDMQSRRYHLTAFSLTEESGPSTHVDVPAYWANIPSIINGSLAIQILDENGNVMQEINATVQGTISKE